MRYFLKRTLAYFIDVTLCYTILILVLQWAILGTLRTRLGLADTWFENSLNMELYVLSTISLPVWFYFTYFDSNRAKGTLGKRLFRLSVQNPENQRISPGKSFLRTFLKLLPWEIAHLGVIFPTPLYFEDEPGLRILTLAGMVLFVSYMISILADPKRRSLYDRLLKTQVNES
ncbi:RDD family protein [Ascidiimonas aurantiaca]|uniref:RDD family protein n=1 Tax=Ascidiimonas aurantiaca TaxID=1685432 RepID=UPI0030EB8354